METAESQTRPAARRRRQQAFRAGSSSESDGPSSESDSGIDASAHSTQRKRRRIAAPESQEPPTVPMSAASSTMGPSTVSTSPLASSPPRRVEGTTPTRAVSVRPPLGTDAVRRTPVANSGTVGAGGAAKVAQRDGDARRDSELESDADSASVAGSASQPTSARGKGKQRAPGSGQPRKSAKELGLRMADDGLPVLPFYRGTIIVHSLGRVVHDNEAFHSDRYIWPVGFVSSRPYFGSMDPTKRVRYVCSIEGEEYPKFVIRCDDDPVLRFEGPSATSAWAQVIRHLQEKRGVDTHSNVSGPDYFGYAHPSVARIIENMPGASLCRRYVRTHEPIPSFPAPVSASAQQDDDFCVVCGNGGELVMCDVCADGFHFACHRPPLDSIPDDFTCMYCASKDVSDVALPPRREKKPQAPAHDPYARLDRSHLSFAEILAEAVDMDAKGGDGTAHVRRSMGASNAQVRRKLSHRTPAAAGSQETHSPDERMSVADDEDMESSAAQSDAGGHAGSHGESAARRERKRERETDDSEDAHSESLDRKRAAADASLGSPMLSPGAPARSGARGRPPLTKEERDRLRHEREVHKEWERLERENQKERERVERAMQREQERLAKEAQRHQERVEREAQKEKERLAREAQKEQERLAREAQKAAALQARMQQKERERLEKEAKKEQERREREAKIDLERQYRQEREAQKEKERQERWEREAKKEQERRERAEMLDRERKEREEAWQQAFIERERRRLERLEEERRARELEKLREKELERARREEAVLPLGQEDGLLLLHDDGNADVKVVPSALLLAPLSAVLPVTRLPDGCVGALLMCAEVGRMFLERTWEFEALVHMLAGSDARAMAIAVDVFGAFLTALLGDASTAALHFDTRDVDALSFQEILRAMLYAIPHFFEARQDVLEALDRREYSELAPEMRAAALETLCDATVCTQSAIAKMEAASIAVAEDWSSLMRLKITENELVMTMRRIDASVPEPLAGQEGAPPTLLETQRAQRAEYEASLQSVRAEHGRLARRLRGLQRQARLEPLGHDRWHNVYYCMEDVGALVVCSGDETVAAIERDADALCDCQYDDRRKSDWDGDASDEETAPAEGTPAAAVADAAHVKSEPSAPGEAAVDGPSVTARESRPLTCNEFNGVGADNVRRMCAALRASSPFSAVGAARWAAVVPNEGESPEHTFERLVASLDTRGVREFNLNRSLHENREGIVRALERTVELRGKIGDAYAAGTHEDLAGLSSREWLGAALRQQMLEKELELKDLGAFGPTYLSERHDVVSAVKKAKADDLVPMGELTSAVACGLQHGTLRAKWLQYKFKHWHEHVRKVVEEGRPLSQLAAAWAIIVREIRMDKLVPSEKAPKKTVTLRLAVNGGTRTESQQSEYDDAGREIDAADGHVNECCLCGTGGKLLLCEAPGCSNAYHAACVGLKSVPRGTWVCPQCKECLHCNRAGDCERCTTCAASFHDACDPPAKESSGMCSRCRSRRYPVVWARVKGHPWWPGRAFSRKKKKLCVSFFGTDEIADLGDAHTRPYGDSPAADRRRSDLLFERAMSQAETYIQYFESRGIPPVEVVDEAMGEEAQPPPEEEAHTPPDANASIDAPSYPSPSVPAEAVASPAVTPPPVADARATVCSPIGPATRRSA